MAVKNHHLNKHKLEVKKPPMKKKVKLLLDDDKPLLKNMVKLGHQVVKNGVLLDYQKINVQFIFRSCKSIKLKKKTQKKPTWLSREVDRDQWLMSPQYTPFISRWNFTPLIPTIDPS